jgi:hypothetical protein
MNSLIAEAYACSKEAAKLYAEVKSIQEECDQ